MCKPLLSVWYTHTCRKWYCVIRKVDIDVIISFQRADVVSVHDEESLKEKDFKVTIKLAAHINLESLMTYMRSGSSLVPPQKAIQALDVVLRSAPMAFRYNIWLATFQHSFLCFSKKKQAYECSMLPLCMHTCACLHFQCWTSWLIFTNFSMNLSLGAIPSLYCLIFWWKVTSFQVLHLQSGGNTI